MLELARFCGQLFLANIVSGSSVDELLLPSVCPFQIAVLRSTF